MAKIHINGETVDMRVQRLPLHQALAIERATGWSVAEFATQLQAGRMAAVAAMAWLVLKFHMGKSELTYEDITEGNYEIDLATWKVELDETDQVETAEGAPGPTEGAATSS